MSQKFLRRFLYTEQSNILANMCLMSCTALDPSWLSCCEVFAMLLDLSCAFEMFLSLPFGTSFEDSCVEFIEILQDLNARALQMHSPCVHSHFAHVNFLLFFEFSALTVVVVVLAMAAMPQRLYIGGWKMGIARQDSSHVRWRFSLALRSFAQSIWRCSCLI